MTSFESVAAVEDAIREDLSDCTASDVEVSLQSNSNDFSIDLLPGSCIDSIAVDCSDYEINSRLLNTSEAYVEESLHSHLLRSLCPVTSQPDMGSVLVTYTGPKIDPAGLLRYVVSYRDHNDFHEACVERMFVDIHEQCRPQKLSVYAAFQRRGGIDINPFRSNFEDAAPHLRLWRQ